MIIPKNYQADAVNKVIDAFRYGVNRGYIYIPIGTGRFQITADIIRQNLNSDPLSTILVVFDYRLEIEQFRKLIFSDGNTIPLPAERVLTTTYQEYTKQSQSLTYSLTIFFNAERVSSDAPPLAKDILSGNFLGIFSHHVLLPGNFFFGTTPIYLFDDYNTRFTEYWYLQRLILPLLEQMGFSNMMTQPNIRVGNNTFRPDITARKDNVHYTFELKVYRSYQTDSFIIQNAIQQVQSYKNMLISSAEDSQQFGLILLCNVDSKTKETVWKQDGIFIWDIKNLLYLCRSNAELSSALSVVIPYPLTGIEAEVPIDLSFLTPKRAPPASEEYIEEHELIRRLRHCKLGRPHATEYEHICEDIIRYLFQTEFSQFSTQHKTRDEMFRMDILCALKGTTAFWKMLTHYYNTKFVVFEFKNSGKKLQQNLIYVTDKYLFHPALRNVAFIISRKGFSAHAADASMGILKDSGKLIIDLTDEDLIEMIMRKLDGEEPSDYLLDKLEKLLMSVSV